jgi:hypothetical protein
MAKKALMTFRVDPELRDKYKDIVRNMSEDLISHMTDVVMAYDTPEREDEKIKKYKILIKQAENRKQAKINEQEKIKKEHGKINERLNKALEPLTQQFKSIGKVSNWRIRQEANNFKVPVDLLRAELMKIDGMKFFNPD